MFNLRYDVFGDKKDFATTENTDIIDRILNVFSSVELKKVPFDEVNVEERPTMDVYTIRLYENNRIVIGIEIFENKYWQLTKSEMNFYMVINEVNYSKIIETEELSWEEFDYIIDTIFV